jgi:hypothetical protein
VNNLNRRKTTTWGIKPKDKKYSLNRGKRNEGKKKK